MDLNTITLNEAANEGSFVYLYFNEEVGFYVAYGLSAYLVCTIVDPVCSYSEAAQMPVALLKREDVTACKQSMKRVEHEIHRYYKLQLSTCLPKDKNYLMWEEKLKNHWKV